MRQLAHDAVPPIVSTANDKVLACLDQGNHPMTKHLMKEALAHQEEESMHLRVPVEPHLVMLTLPKRVATCHMLRVLDGSGCFPDVG